MKEVFLEREAFTILPAIADTFGTALRIRDLQCTLGLHTSEESSSPWYMARGCNPGPLVIFKLFRNQKQGHR